MACASKVIDGVISKSEMPRKHPMEERAMTSLKTSGCTDGKNGSHVLTEYWKLVVPFGPDAFANWHSVDSFACTPTCCPLPRELVSVLSQLPQLW